MNRCRKCGSSPGQAKADARAIGFEAEFIAGQYVCCQVVSWADEQWLAWAEAAAQDGKPVDVTRLLEVEEDQPDLVPVRLRNMRRQNE